MPKMSLSDYARHRKVTPAAVSRAVKEGRISVEVDAETGKKRVDSDAADVEWSQNTDRAKQEGALSASEARAGDAPGDRGEPTEEATQSSYQLARARREHFNAKIAELNYQMRAGRLVDADEVTRAAFKTARAVREAMLNIPDRLASQLAGETDARRVHDLLTAELERALEALADGL